MSTFERSDSRFTIASHGIALAAVGTAVTLVLAVSAVTSDRDTFWVVLCCGLAFTALASAWSTSSAARASAGRRRWVWAAMTAGLIAWAIGTAVSAARPPGDVTVPVGADIGHAAFWLAAFSALVLVPVNSWDFSWLRVVLDAVIVGTALFIVAWLLIVPVAQVADNGDTWAMVVTVTYLSATVAVTTIGALVVSHARGRHRVVLVLLAIAITVMALTRAAFVHLVAQAEFDAAILVALGWGVGVLLIGAAAALRATTAGEGVASPLPPKTSLWLPYLPILAACAVLAGELFSVPGLRPVLAAVLVMVSAVVARQFLVMRDNRRLVAAATAQALRDPLTGVGNRALLHDRLTHALDLRQRDPTPLTVVTLDLDDFKLVNVSLGHPAGDRLLVVATERVMACLRTGDTLARLGGDEFGILMEGSLDGARAAARRMVQAFDAPVKLDGHDLMVRPSIGLADLSAEDVGVSAEVLLLRAEAAMYAAKAAGSGGLRIYTPDLDSPGPTAARATVESVQLLGELRRAIDRAELAVVYQPQVDLRSARVVGVEALVRWPHERLGMLDPDRFLPLVRHHGLMPAVTAVVVRRALDDLAGWHRQGCAVPVSVNLFAPSLGDVTLPLTVAWALAERDLPAGLLTIEITEDLVLDNMRRTRSVLDELRARGIKISIDDFGSGYSALSYLRELPVDEMKICRQLVDPITVDPRAEAVVRVVIELAHILGARVVAEGVEDEATSARLLGLDCDVGQGFHYHRPLDLDSTTALLCAQAHQRFEKSVSG